MKFSWLYRPLQISAVASTMLLALTAGAQTAATAIPTAPAATPASQSTAATPQIQKRPQRHHKPRHHRRADGQEPANAASLATSSQNYGAADYQRNGVTRCEVFKAPEDRAACVKRVQQTPQGSIEGGGLLREYSYEVPAGGS